MNNIGLVGLGVMGSSLALNMSKNSYSVSVYDYSPDLTKRFMDRKDLDGSFTAFYEIKDFVDSLERPRKIILMTKSGKPVDSMLELLRAYLDPGDLIMDCGNTYFEDTNRRIEELGRDGIYFLGVGVSGGELGALMGPSIMPGGDIEAYEMVAQLFEDISAKTEDGPCASYIGKGSSGHFVKMLHNGIEYAMMQGIAEAYDILRKVLRLSNNEIADVFETWNEGELNSYLMEISYKILRTIDPETNLDLVDLILDKAGQKGTGKWTSQTAYDLGIPASSINASVEARQISSFKEMRKELSKNLIKEYNNKIVDKEKLILELEKTLLFTNIIIFSQGIWLMNEASKEYDYGINILEVLRIWKGGCIIRAALLDFLREVIKRTDENENLLRDGELVEYLMDKLDSVNYIRKIAGENYIATFSFNNSLDYFFSLMEEDLPANLIQAQRDFFGAHTYERKDREGIFHTKWE